MSLCSKFLGCNPENQSIYSKDEDLVYQRCNDCGIIWRDPASFHLEKSYDQDYFDSKDYAKNRQHKITKSGWLLDLALSFQPGIKRLLEVGCSLGNTLEAAKQRGLDHLGIDVSAFAVAYCLQQGLNASEQSLDQLVQEDESFQLIFMQHVLEHFQDPFEVLKQCNQLLDKNGLLVILIPNSEYRRARLLKEKHKFYSKAGVGLEHYVYFNYHNLERVLNVTGFKLVQRNYPLQTVRYDSLGFYLNRLGRRMLSALKNDQELVVVAEKSTDILYSIA